MGSWLRLDSADEAWAARSVSDMATEARCVAHRPAPPCCSATGDIVYTRVPHPTRHRAGVGHAELRCRAAWLLTIGDVLSVPASSVGGVGHAISGWPMISREGKQL